MHVYPHAQILMNVRHPLVNTSVLTPLEALLAFVEMDMNLTMTEGLVLVCIVKQSQR